MKYNKEILEKTGIFVFENAFSQQLCDDTIKAFYDNPSKHFKGKTGGGYRSDVKNTLDWHIHLDNLNNKYFSILALALEEIKKVRCGLKDYPITWAGLQFQKNFKDQGFFKWHTDNDEHNRNEGRILAPIFYLNDVTEGGETEFMYQKFSVKPKAGLLVIFPSTWTYYHRGVIPRSNHKYIITTFGLTPR